MRHYLVAAFGVAALLSGVSVRAQSIPSGAVDVPGRTSTTGQGASTDMPVTMPRGTEVLSAENAGNASRPTNVSIEQPIDPDQYICGPGDVFEVNFWGQQNFRLRVSVDLEGRTFISKVGFVPVTGKTLSAVRADVKKRLRANYPGLQSDLTLTNPRTFIVHVAANVRSPGAYTANPLERVSSVLARAGGPVGSRRRIEIKRRVGPSVIADLVLYEQTGNTQHNPYVLDGDIINVPFAETVVTISGAVRRPGSYELVKGKDLGELLELAGGFAPNVAKHLPIRIVRLNDREQEAFVDLDTPSSAKPGVTLRNQDRVLVRTIDELRRTVLLIGAVSGADALDTATTSRRLEYVEGDSVLSLIERAGGIRSQGDMKHAYISRTTGGAPPKLIPLDLEALLVRRDFKADRPVFLTDTIVIPPLRHSVLVEGAVVRAGLYPHNPLFSINEYVAFAGGRTRTARELDEVKLIDVNGKTHPYRKGLVPSPGDAILVPERNFTRAEVVQLVIASAGVILSGIAIGLAAR